MYFLAGLCDSGDVIGYFVSVISFINQVLVWDIRNRLSLLPKDVFQSTVKVMLRKKML